MGSLCCCCKDPSSSTDDDRDTRLLSSSRLSRSQDSQKAFSKQTQMSPVEPRRSDRQPVTERDRLAQSAAAEAAAARQEKFESSAIGRAHKEAARREKAKEVAEPDTARDWLS